MTRFFYHAFLVAAGSAAGGLTRWLVGMGAAALFGTSFPWGTLIINLSGCVFLGWLGTLLADRLLPGADEVRLLLAVGFCGAYTTFSTFEYEADKLFKDGDGTLGLLYLGASVFLGLLAIRLGVFLARHAWGGG
jgi:CrcB protein